MEARYVNSRLEFRLSAAQRHPEIGNSVNTQSLSFGTALAYADRRVVISRPLHGQAFALLSGKAGLGDQTVKVIRGQGSRPSAMISRPCCSPTTGSFRDCRVVPGRYTVRLDAPHTYRGELNVQKEILGRLDIGDVVMEQR